jgi:hypothetical protein
MGIVYGCPPVNATVIIMKNSIAVLSSVLFLAVASAHADDSTTPVRRAELATGIVYMFDSRGKMTGRGSGFFVNTNGYFLTNYHVIEGRHKGGITMQNGAKFAIRHVVNYSAKHDIALVLTTTNWQHHLEIADPSSTRSGLKINTMGAPRGLGWIHTIGTIEGVLYESYLGINAVQHNAKLEPGSSGGPAFDDNGFVHSINTMAMPRKVLKSSGQYTLSWDTPRFLGATASDIAAITKARERPTNLDYLARQYANHEVATWLLFACYETDYTIRYMRDSIKEMDIVRQRLVDSSKRGVSGRAKVVSDRSYWLNVDRFNDSIREFENLKTFVLPQMPMRDVSDPNIKGALNYWVSCIDQLNKTIDRMIKSQGASSQEFARTYDDVKLDFTQANDFYYHALSLSANAFKQYRPFSTKNIPDPLTWESVAELQRYYYDRGLELKK